MRKALFITAMAAALQATAQNPFVQTWCTSDPAPLVHDGTMYVYTGHDEDGADFFWMQEWRVYSTEDMVNWQDHGSPLALESFSWADDRAWASQCIERDGKFYCYPMVWLSVWPSATHRLVLSAMPWENRCLRMALGTISIPP